MKIDKKIKQVNEKFNQEISAVNSLEDFENKIKRDPTVGKSIKDDKIGKFISLKLIKLIKQKIQLIIFSLM